MKPTVLQFEIGPYKNFVYLVLDWNTQEAAIIDPQTDVTLPVQFLKSEGFQLRKILLTHTHWDHVGGVLELLGQFPDVRLLVHPLDFFRLNLSQKTQEQVNFLQDGEKIHLGSQNLTVVHTPGHSAGECCFYLESTNPPQLFTGDTLFIRDCGRTDLETGNTTELFHSLQRLKQLPPETIILPGHHYTPECTSVLQKELLTSPPLLCSSPEELEKLP